MSKETTVTTVTENEFDSCDRLTKQTVTSTEIIKESADSDGQA